MFTDIKKSDEAKEEVDNNSCKIVCALFGTVLCPLPDKCNGFDRLCNNWKNHSSR